MLNIRFFAISLSSYSATTCMMGIHEKLVSFEENFEIGHIVLLGHPNAAVCHEVAIFVIGSLEGSRHEILCHDVPVA